MFQLVAYLMGFEIAIRAINNPALVPPSGILTAIADLIASGELLGHALDSLLIVSAGLYWSILGGVGLALVMVRYEQVRCWLMPVIDACRQVAAIAFFPAIIVLLGLGASSRTFIVCWTAFPAVLLSTLHGLESVDRDVLGAAQVDGANAGQILWLVQLPLAKPLILTSIRLAAGLSWLSLIAAEMLGSNSGLGYAALMYSQSFEYPKMYAAVVAIAAIGYGMTRLVQIYQKRSSNETD